MRFGLLGVVGVLCLVACSEESSSGGGADGGASGSAATGGASTGSGGADQTGGASSATGGTIGTGGSGGVASGSGGASGGSGGIAGSSGSGGASTGGTGNATSVCPPDSDAMMLDLSGSVEPVAGVPPSGYGSFNLEGPVWADGALYMSEIKGGQNPPPSRILKYVPGSGVSVFIDDSGTNGLALDPTGRLLGASHGVGGIVRFDWQSPNGTPETLAGSYEDSRFGSPNDLTVNDAGIIYFTDPFYQAGSERPDAERAYWVDGTGTVRPIAGAPTPPNGIALSPDQRTLYIGGGDPLRSFPVDSTGAPGAGAQFGDMEYRGVDGMGVDCAGNLYVSLHNEGVVAVVSPSGSRVGTITVAPQVTNVAFGGADRKTLFITKLNPPTLYSLNVGIAGYPY